MARVLLCASGGAADLPAIVRALQARSAEPLVLDASAFPDGALATLEYGESGFRPGWGRDVLRGISAVWQRAVVASGLPAMAPGVRETCVAASERAVIGLLDSLQVFQLDPYWSCARADNKPAQLGLAQRLGLAIPETIISNDPEAVRAFARRVGPVITKMLVQPVASEPAGADGFPVVFTTALDAAALEQLDGLDLCPMIFQQQIENRRDVRVTVVGRQVFGAALDRAARGGDELDWRRQSYAEDRAPVWTPYELPGAIAERLVQLLDRVGLNYGAADFIVDPDGRHVFLELNALGSFAFLGAGLAEPIARAIARVLTEPGARRVGHV